MNLSLSGLRSLRIAPLHLGDDHDSAQLKRVRSLLSLFALYAGALLLVILISDGADIGCILAGIAGHVLYASGKTAVAWRDASWIANARMRVAARKSQRRQPARTPAYRFAT